MKKNILILSGLLLVLLSFSFSIHKEKKVNKIQYIPAEGVVPDSVTAIKIAEAIWDPIYGKKQIDSEKPFQIRLNKEGTVWVVSGYFEPSHISIDKKGDTTFTIHLGGVAEIEIQKSDCKILNVTHGK